VQRDPMALVRMAREHHAASHGEPGLAGVLDDTSAPSLLSTSGALASRVSTRQDRLIERRDAVGRDADQHLVAAQAIRSAAARHSPRKYLPRSHASVCSYKVTDL
jgi:hypothetical protein